jgi:DNA polymerase
MSMLVRPGLTAQSAAKALVQWWELAGLEAPDLSAVRTGDPVAGAASSPSVQSQKPKITPARAITGTHQPQDALAQAHRLAAACTSMDALYKALESFEGCGLKANARTTVFADGCEGAPIMVVGEVAGREDDEAGKPFLGPVGALLDKMLASIGLNRATNTYLTCLVPWRPPGGRSPTAEEIALCRPFVVRHIELAAPKAILMVGGLTGQTLLNSADGIMKLRTRHFDYRLGLDEQSACAYAQCLFAPNFLLNRPMEKAAAWQDLVRFAQKISALGIAT